MSCVQQSHVFQLSEISTYLKMSAPNDVPVLDAIFI